MHAANPHHVCRHEFICRAPAANAVFLVGDFNGWNPQATPMTSRGNGLWWITLELQAGNYHFQFICDDVWYSDTDCIAAAQSAPHPNLILTQRWIG